MGERIPNTLAVFHLTRIWRVSDRRFDRRDFLRRSRKLLYSSNLQWNKEGRKFVGKFLTSLSRYITKVLLKNKSFIWRHWDGFSGGWNSRKVCNTEISIFLLCESVVTRVSWFDTGLLTTQVSSNEILTLSDKYIVYYYSCILLYSSVLVTTNILSKNALPFFIAHFSVRVAEATNSSRLNRHTSRSSTFYCFARPKSETIPGASMHLGRVSWKKKSSCRPVAIYYNQHLKYFESRKKSSCQLSFWTLTSTFVVAQLIDLHIPALGKGKILAPVMIRCDVSDIFLLLLTDCIVMLQDNGGRYTFLSGQVSHKFRVRYLTVYGSNIGPTQIFRFKWFCITLVHVSTYCPRFASSY